MTKLEDVIRTDYGDIEIWSQDEMEYFFQNKQALRENKQALWAESEDKNDSTRDGIEK